MMGLAIIFFFLLYLAISAGVVWFFAKHAKQRGIAGWKWGVPAGLVMYLLVFWDHIPTLVAHKYYCDKYAGLTVYKTPEQWKAENPGVAEVLSRSPDALRPSISESLRKYEINQRFRWEVRLNDQVLGIKKVENVIVDKKDSSILIDHVDFSTDIKNISLGNVTLRDYKIWMNRESCESDRTPGEVEFKKFKKQIWDMGGE